MSTSTWSGFIVPSHLNCPRMKAAAQELVGIYKEGVDVSNTNPNGAQTWFLSDRCLDALIALEDRMIAELGALPGYSPEIIAQRTLKNDKYSNRYPIGLDAYRFASENERIHGKTSWLAMSLIGLLANIEHEAMSARYTTAIPALEARLAAAEELIQAQAAALKAAEDRQIAVAAAAILAGQKLKEQEEINKKLLERLSALEKILL